MKIGVLAPLYPSQVIFFLFMDTFPSLRIFVRKKVGNRKKTTFIISVLKVVYQLPGGLSFYEIHLFFTNKNYQGRKMSAK